MQPADQVGNVWLFGGYAEPEGKPRHVVNDLLRYDGSGWQQLQEPIDVTLKGGRVRDNRPGPRLATASCVVGDEMLVFGGWDPQTPGTGGGILDDVWSLSLAKQTWRRLAAPMPGGPASPLTRVWTRRLLTPPKFHATLRKESPFDHVMMTDFCNSETGACALAKVC